MFEHVAGQDGLDSQDAVGFLAAATGAMAKLPSQLWRTGNERFAAIAAGLDALAVQLDCARVGLVGEAESRGVVDQSPAPTSAAWLLEHSLHLEPAEASRTAKLSHLCALSKNQVMAAAVCGGTVTVRKAMTALGQLAAVKHDLAPGGREQALGWLTVMAQTGHNVHVIAVGRRLMAMVGADGALERDEDKLRALNSLRLTPLENGMTAISGQLDLKPPPCSAPPWTPSAHPTPAPRTAAATHARPTDAAPKPSSRSAGARPPPAARPPRPAKPRSSS